MDPNLDLTQLMKLAQSPAGQKLLQILQQNWGKDMQAAVKSASAGNYPEAKQALSSFLKDPDVQKLLNTLEESK